MKSDYTSAATMPTKMFHNQVVQKGKIVPYHVTITPTNVCNETCAECFCKNRDKTAAIPYKEFTKITDTLYDLGTRAISLSGGGEPDCHPDINKIIKYVHNKDMDVALVTNSKALNRIDTNALNLLDWVRVSSTTTRPVDLEKLATHVKRAPDAGWGHSLVLGQPKYTDFWFDPQMDYMKGLIGMTNEPNFSHLRIVSDMMHPDENRIPLLKRFIDDSGIDTSKVIWQERTENEKGIKDCKVGLLHPVIDATGYMQPCCGIHFATTPPAFDFNEDTSMCHWTNYAKRVEDQEVFDGENCDICQYMDYNRTLEMLLTKPANSRFV